MLFGSTSPGPSPEMKLILRTFRSISAEDSDQQPKEPKDTVALPFEGARTRNNKGPTHMDLDTSD